jgi:hypothetical protein
MLREAGKRSLVLTAHNVVGEALERGRFFGLFRTVKLSTEVRERPGAEKQRHAWRWRRAMKLEASHT